MSDVWNEGYFTGVGYTYGYYREISPVYQRFCLLIRGFAAAETADAAHCELGFGQGVSANIHAAANPGQYAGTDFNPAHAAHARTLAAAAGSGARLYDDSFEQLLDRSDLPAFDSISLHGIWTWVSPDNHKIIAEFARRHLKPGGVFYISYNCFPGWAPAYPLRQLFALHDRYGGAAHGDAVKRVEAALTFSGALLAAKPAYLNSAPGLDKRLAKINEQNRHYLAHEYFNREWNCMYFTDVVDALTPAKLDFATTAVPLDTVDAVNLSKEGIDFLNTIEQPVLREQARDYFVNQQFRRDLFMRGAVRLRPVEQHERLLATRLVLVQNPDAVPKKVQGAAGEGELQVDLYRPLLEMLASRQHAPKSLRELLKALPDAPFARVVQAVIVLVGMGAVQPCQPEDHARQVKKTCVALNEYLCERAQFGPEITVLSSPVTGSGVTVDRIGQLFLLAQARKRNDAPSFVWEVLQANNEVLMKDGQPLQGAEANLAELRERHEYFVKQSHPILKAVGVI